MSMVIRQIERRFEKIGARARVAPASGRNASANIAIDIARDEEGEYFDIALPRRQRPELLVLDAQPRLRHLLLMARQDDEKSRFLCGHDERHWFVAAVPEKASASNVKTAFEALRPPAVRSALIRQKVRGKKRNRRRNAAFVRQGEWFFLPWHGQEFPRMLILRNEPLRRGGGKPHMCEELVRVGGEVVYVSRDNPNGLTETQYRRLLSRKPKLINAGWSMQRRNPGVFVRGRVRHADHKTIVLNGWHRVVMNTETEAKAMRHVMFID